MTSVSEDSRSIIPKKKDEFSDLWLHDGSLYSWISKALVFFLYTGSQVVLVAVALWRPDYCFYFLAFSTIFTLFSSMRPCIFGYFTTRRLIRRGESEAAKQEWLDLPLGTARQVVNFLIFPNYKEEETTLFHSLQSISRAPIAKEIRIVLAMEEREGVEGKEKAENIATSFAGCFKDIRCTYHPSGLPHELPGKASNEAWAYWQIRGWCEEEKLDPNNVLLTVVDSDCLVDPLYFNALIVDFCRKSEEERNWSIWQPPQVHVRNFWDVPILTRCIGTVQMLYELSGSSSPGLWTHMCFSTYTLTLALANHVHGWDSYSVAEDQHMFTKCSFANAKALLTNPNETVPALRLCPIETPVFSFMAEGMGFRESISERFAQAYRHAFAILEIEYFQVLYMRMVQKYGMPFLMSRGHWRLLRLYAEMLFQTIPVVWHTGSVILVSSLLIWHYGFYGLTYPCLELWPETSSREFVVACRVAQAYYPLVVVVGIGMIHLTQRVLYMQEIWRADDESLRIEKKRQVFKSCRWMDVTGDKYLFIRQFIELLVFAAPASFIFGWVPFVMASTQSFQKDLSFFDYKSAGRPQIERRSSRYCHVSV